MKLLQTERLCEEFVSLPRSHTPAPKVSMFMDVIQEFFFALRIFYKGLPLITRFAMHKYINHFLIRCHLNICANWCIRKGDACIKQLHRPTMMTLACYQSPLKVYC